MSGHAADTAPLVIGSGTKNGRRPVSKPPHYPQPKGEVYLHMRHVVVGHKDLGTLVRFSKIVALAFPKPSEGTVQVFEEGAQIMVTVEKNGTGKMPKIDRKVGEVAGVFVPITTDDGERVLVLKLDDSRFWNVPSERAVSIVFGWMDQVKQANGDAPLGVIACPELNKANFRLGCEVYAATLLLDIRPAAATSKIIEQLTKTITNTPPSLEMLMAVHETLPISNVLMDLTITSFFEHLETGNFDNSNVSAVEVYAANMDEQLAARFRKIRNTRPVHHAFLSGGQAQHGGVGGQREGRSHGR